MNIVDWVRACGTPTLLYFPDTKKAFDRLEWGSLKQVLRRLNFGSVFLQWINLIYHKTFARVMLEGLESQGISIDRGVRQGCPISFLI